MDPQNPNIDNEYASKGYALSGKIMLSAVVVLFFVVVVMVCLHFYARWYLLNTRRRQRRNRRTHLVFYVDPSNPNPHHVTVPSHGLDATVLRSLPVFLYSSKTHPDSIECAVCLSEFEENEPGRTLRKCNHSFHVECIDMWFHSHSTCPLCRSPVEPVPENTIDEINEIGSSSGLCVTCQHEADNTNVVASTSSFNPRTRIGVTIQVPVRNGNFGDESVTESPSSYRSPMSRMLSFRRILSRERRGNASSPSGNQTGCGGGSFTELDIEKGREETSQT